MKRFLIIMATPLLAFVLNSCLEEGEVGSPTAEMYYVDLFYALHQYDRAGAETAVRELTELIAELPINNYHLLKEDETGRLNSPLGRARHGFSQVRASIESNDLEQAAIELNRATTSLKDANVPGLDDFYIARTYDFLNSWLEVDRASQRNASPDRDWRILKRRIKTAHSRWQEVRWIRPSPAVYYFPADSATKFNLAHGEVDRLLDLLKASLSEDHPLQTHVHIDAADTAVWQLVHRFGSPDNTSLKTSSLYLEELE